MNLAPVYIVDDEKDVRSSLVLLLRSYRIETRQFVQSEDFLEELKFLQPGVVLLDLRMPEMTGTELLLEMRRRNCFWPTIMMSGHGDIPVAVQAIKLGARDFLEKPFSEDELMAALHECSRILPSAISKSRAAQVRDRLLTSLTPRERQVLDGVLAGKTNKVIAAEFDLSPRTVESYRLSMMTKVGARNLSELLNVTKSLELEQ